MREGAGVLLPAVEDSPDPHRVRPLFKYFEETRREVRQLAGGLALLQLGGRGRDVVREEAEREVQRARRVRNGQDEVRVTFFVCNMCVSKVYSNIYFKY